MSVSMSSGAVSLTVQAAAPAFAIQSQSANVQFASTKTTNGTATVGTVPAGKQWRILNSWCALSLQTTANGTACLKLNGAKIIDLYGDILTSGGSNVSVALNCAYNACPILAATQTAQITSDSLGVQVSGGIIYVEEPTGTI